MANMGLRKTRAPGYGDISTAEGNLISWLEEDKGLTLCRCELGVVSVCRKTVLVRGLRKCIESSTKSDFKFHDS